jgi:flagellar hook-associated protein 3 FlgL
MRVLYDVVRDGLTAINAAAEQMAEARTQVSTGRRLHVASDDPVGSAQAIAERATIGSLDAYTSTASAASSRLAAADTAMTAIIDKLTAALTTAAGARGSTSTPLSRTAAAGLIRGLRDSVAADFNAKSGGTYLLAGSRTDQPPYTGSGTAWTYHGDATPVQVEVDRGRLVSITVNGQAIAQGSDATDVFSTLETLAADIEANNHTGMAAGMDAIERAFNRAVQAQSRIGTDERGTEEAAAHLSTLRLAADVRRSKIEDANLAEAIATLNQSENAYKAALGAVSSAERLSLLDYLR